MPWYIPLASALLGGLLALIGIWLKLLLDRDLDEKRAYKIVRNEVADLARHYDRNVSRLRAMRYNLENHALWPDIVHLEKLRWPEDTFLFTSDSIKNCSAAAVAEIYKFRLRIRNANLDSNAVLRAYNTGIDEMFAKALEFVEKRHSRIESLALAFLGKQQLERRDSDEDERREYAAAKDMLYFDKPLTAAPL